MVWEKISFCNFLFLNPNLKDHTLSYIINIIFTYSNTYYWMYALHMLKGESFHRHSQLLLIPIHLQLWWIRYVQNKKYFKIIATKKNNKKQNQNLKSSLYIVTYNYLVSTSTVFINNSVYKINPLPLGSSDFSCWFSV